MCWHHTFAATLYTISTCETTLHVMAILYKYVEPDIGPNNKPKPVLVLESLRLIAADPCSFNDPFEVRPWYDQERHDHSESSHEKLQRLFRGNRSQHQIGQDSLVGYPAELAAFNADNCHKKFQQGISDRYRILCLSRNPGSVLMWAHYAKCHKGIVIGIETSDPDFQTGLNPTGYNVEYDPDRSKIRLPVAYYRQPSVEMYDQYGNVINHPDEEVESNAGLIIPFREYRRQVEVAQVTALRTKAQDWGYEKETRFIYDLSIHSGKLTREGSRHFVALPADSIREIIIGFCADLHLVKSIVGLYRDGRIGKPRLAYTECHPSQYEVLAHEADVNYLEAYFQHVRPNL